MSDESLISLNSEIKIETPREREARKREEILKLGYFPKDEYKEQNSNVAMLKPRTTKNYHSTPPHR